MSYFSCTFIIYGVVLKDFHKEEGVVWGCCVLVLWKRGFTIHASSVWFWFRDVIYSRVSLLSNVGVHISRVIKVEIFSARYVRPKYIIFPSLYPSALDTCNWVFIAR